MSGFRLVRLSGRHAQDEWPLPTGRPTLVGRRDNDRGAPDVDLPFDRYVSRQHARIWFERDAWWVRDLGSENGTRVGSCRLAGGAAARLEPGVEVQFGSTVLALFPPHWHRLQADALMLELSVSPSVSYALLHAGAKVISRLVARNLGAAPLASRQLLLSYAGLAQAAVTVPGLEPGESRALVPPAFDLNPFALQLFAERTWHPLSVELDDMALEGGRIGSWFLAYNEWSWVPEQRSALAAFVLPNHPAVLALARAATADLSLRATPETMLQQVYDHLSSAWRLDYRLELPHYESHSQRIRLPDQILGDFTAARGEGTCLDLAVLMASCLEALHVQPLVAIIDLGPSWHAVVGCWRQAAATLEPIVAEEERLVEDAVWVDPNGCTRDPAQRVGFAQAQAAAVSKLRRVVFAIDVSAARGDGITPLPFTGEPQWSPAVLAAISGAQAAAEGARAEVALVPLLIGLLRVDGGVTSRVFQRQGGDPGAVAARLAVQLGSSNRPRRQSRHYIETLALAKARARAEASLVVLEKHVLQALLDCQSSALDEALRCVGTDRAALRSALQQLGESPATQDGESSIFAGPSEATRS